MCLKLFYMSLIFTFSPSSLCPKTFYKMTNHFHFPFLVILVTLYPGKVVILAGGISAFYKFMMGHFMRVKSSSLSRDEALPGMYDIVILTSQL